MHLACENFRTVCESNRLYFYSTQHFFFHYNFSSSSSSFSCLFRFSSIVLSCLCRFNCWTSCSGGVYVSLVRVFIRYRCMHISFISDMHLTIVTPVSAVAFVETNQTRIQLNFNGEKNQQQQQLSTCQQTQKRRNFYFLQKQQQQPWTNSKR